jgi:carboxyl-terminal processing protease
LRTANLPRWNVLVVLSGVLLFFFTSLVPAAPLKDIVGDDLKNQAKVAQQKGEWAQACALYEKSLQQNRNQPDCREGIAQCTRRIHQGRRFTEPGYALSLGKLSFSQSLDVYEQVLNVVSLAYVDSSKADLNVLFQRGVEEVRFALDSDAFRRSCLVDARPDLIERCQRRLHEWDSFKIAAKGDGVDQALAVAREQVQTLVRTLQNEGLDLKPRAMVALTFEFAAGACNALDEYSFFLTPGFFNDLSASLRGKTATIGVELIAGQTGLEISRVYPSSPAEEANLKPGVRIRSIDGKAVSKLTPEVVADRLRGENGSSLEIEVQYPGRMDTDTIKLVRRPVVVTSVDVTVIPTPDYIGHVRVYHFQDSTAQEIKEAITHLQGRGIKGLILDLRGNPGGSFKAAMQAAELFLTEGLIVQTQAPRHIKEFNRPFEIKGNNPLLSSMIPVVVLVDGETASAAEALAGALKERKRALLYGEQTYGKFTIQCLITLNKKPLTKLAAGIRITVARFSPTGKFTEGGQGLKPDYLVPSANALNAACNYFQKLFEPPTM